MAEPVEVMEIFCPACGRNHPLLLLPIDGAIICACGAEMYNFKIVGDNIIFKYSDTRVNKSPFRSFVKKLHEADDKTLWWDIPIE